MHVPSLLLPDEVLAATFPTTRFRPGYEQDAVDRWLDDVVRTMRGHLSGSPLADPVRSSDVAAATFPQTRFRDGYDPAAVDDLLDRIQATLAALERGERPR